MQKQSPKDWGAGRIRGPQDLDKLTVGFGFTHMRAVTFVGSPRDILRPFDQGYQHVELVIGHRLNASPDAALKAAITEEGQADPSATVRAIMRMKELMDSNQLEVRVSKGTEHSKYIVVENSETIRFIAPSYNLTGSHQGNDYLFLDFSKSDPGAYDEAEAVYRDIRSESARSHTLKELMDRLRGKPGEAQVSEITLWLTASPPSQADKTPERHRRIVLAIKEALETLSAWEKAHPGEPVESAPEEQFRTKAMILPSDPAEREGVLRAVADYEPRVIDNTFSLNARRTIKDTWVQSSGKIRTAYWPTALVTGGELLIGFDGKSIPRTAVRLDKAAIKSGLESIEGYINTVDRAQTANPRVLERAKRMMYETLIYLFAAPFQHDYMARRRAQYLSDKEGPPLLILTGQSGNGKTRFLEYCLKLMVGEAVGVLHASETLTKAKARAARRRILCFPLVFDELTEKWLSSRDGKDLVTSWWPQWWEDDMPTPAIVFCGNDIEQKPWMGRRTKRVEFEVHFQKTDENEQLLGRLLSEPNDIYPFFTRQYMEEVERGTVSVDDPLRAARTTMLSLYDIAGVNPPPFFPFEPVDADDVGRERWIHAISGGKITMDTRGNPYLANFAPDMEKQVPEYLGYIRDVLHRRDGLMVELGVPEAFLTWIGGPEKLNDAMLSAQRLKLEAAAQPAALPRVGPAPALGTQPGPFSEEDVRRLIREQVDAAVAAGLKPAALTSEPKPGEPRGVRGLLRRLRAKG